MNTKNNCLGLYLPSFKHRNSEEVLDFEDFINFNSFFLFCNFHLGIYSCRLGKKDDPILAIN